jgi:hypothetical protein
MSMAAYPELRLQRTLVPGLDTLKEDEIRGALERPLEVKAPASAAVAWLDEGARGGRAGYPGPLNDYQRTGVIDATLEALRQEPFSSVTSLPTVAPGTDGGGESDRLLAVRSAAARFQAEIAILMQTGTAESSGYNPLAVGFLPLVTVPLVPGIDLGMSASAELCAVDVRSGVMIACTRGRAQETRRYLFVSQQSEARGRLRESTTRQAAVTAAQDLVAAVGRRLATR